MKDTDLYAQILGIVAPWRFSTVELKTDESKVDKPTFSEYHNLL